MSISQVMRAAETLYATVKEPAPVALEVVRQRLVGEADEDTLLQMLGLAPYQPGRRPGRGSGSHEPWHVVRTHNVNGYKRGCRCATCRLAMFEHRKTHRDQIKQHGTETAYKNGGCRCSPCTAAAAAAARRRREAKCLATSA